MSVQTVAETHPPNDRRAHAFGIRHRFVGRDIVGQIVLVDAALVAFLFTHTAPTEFYTLSLHDALPIHPSRPRIPPPLDDARRPARRHPPATGPSQAETAHCRSPPANPRPAPVGLG